MTFEVNVPMSFDKAILHNFGSFLLFSFRILLVLQCYAVCAVPFYVFSLNLINFSAVLQFMLNCCPIREFYSFLRGFPAVTTSLNKFAVFILFFLHFRGCRHSYIIFC